MSNLESAYIKSHLIDLCIDMVEIGNEMIYLIKNDKFVDYEFRINQINLILNVLKKGYESNVVRKVK